MDSTKLNNMISKFKNQSKNSSKNGLSLTNSTTPMKSLIPMLSIKNIIVGSIGTVIPWLILLFICTFLIII